MFNSGDFVTPGFALYRLVFEDESNRSSPLSGFLDPDRVPDIEIPYRHVIDVDRSLCHRQQILPDDGHGARTFGREHVMETHMPGLSRP